MGDIANTSLIKFACVLGLLVEAWGGKADASKLAANEREVTDDDAILHCPSLISVWQATAMQN